MYTYNLWHYILLDEIDGSNKNAPENTNRRGKYHCTSGLQLKSIGNDHRRKYIVSCCGIQLNWRPAVILPPTWRVLCLHLSHRLVWFHLRMFDRKIFEDVRKMSNLNPCKIFSLHLPLFEVTWWQCDQIWQFFGLWATFQSLWQQLICPNLPHS